MSGTSNVGQGSVYEAGDQRNVPQAEIDQAKKDNRFHEGKENSHKALDSKDQRSIANKLAREGKRTSEDEETEETKQLKQDPTLPARMHGNEPSRGAKIDAQIQQEEEDELKRKGKAWSDLGDLNGRITFRLVNWRDWDTVNVLPKSYSIAAVFHVYKWLTTMNVWLGGLFIFPIFCISTG